MAEAPPPPAPPARSPLWMRILLVVSLALNLLVAGMVVGAVTSGGGPGAAGQTARELAGTPFVRALAPEDRRAVLRALVRERRSLRENRETLRQRFEMLVSTLRAETLDRAALERVVAAQRQAGEARQDLGQRVILDRIAAMSLAERRAYADRLEAEVRRPRRR